MLTFSLANQVAEASIPSEEGFGDFKGYQVQFTINNLLDEDYISGIAGGSSGWIGAPRTAAFNVVLDF